jgi:hypothetical protein
LLNLCTGLPICQSPFAKKASIFLSKNVDEIDLGV